MRKNLKVIIEEYLNNHAIPFSHDNAEQFAEIASEISSVMDKPTDRESVLNLITEFINAHNKTELFFKSSGEINASKFRALAQMDQSSWESIRDNTPHLLESTIFRICFALELSTDEAERLMRASGRAYTPFFSLHVVVFSLLDMKIYDYETVYIMLDFFGEQCGFKNIYRDI